jgi:c-di-GMP-binding flagellar brake protein YcgR
MRKGLSYAGPMPENQSYPFVKQGVRLLTEGPAASGAQLTAVVDTVWPEGKIDLGLIDAGKASLLKPGMVVTLEYFREGIVYKLRAAIAEQLTPSTGPRAFPRIRLGIPIEIKKIQRRRFPRALVGLDVHFIKIEMSDDFDPSTKKSKKQLQTWGEEIAARGHAAVTETLSGSGLRMRTSGDAEKGEWVLMRIELPDAPFDLLGEVVWQGSSKPRESPGASIGVEFKYVADETRQAVLQFVAGQKYLH